MINIDLLYTELLNNKKQYLFFNKDNKEYVLTKEKSIIPIHNTKEFIDKYKNDIYYRTHIIDYDINININDLKLYYSYINKYRNELTNKKYDKYLFGCIAIKTDNGFITTIRGKEDLDEYTVVTSVDHDKHIVTVNNKKATLNAPLLDNIFKNKKIKVIVHLHEFDNKLPYYEYAFPGTVKDSFRNNNTSFNIRYHGLFYLFDNEGNML